jgi:repressor LexA
MFIMTPKTPPGQTREQIYEFMRDRLLEGQPPTVREVQERFGFKAVQSAQAHLEQLVAEGRLIKRLGPQRGKARGYALPESSVDYSTPMVFAPLLGHVQAGDLSAAIEDREGTIPVQRGNRRASEQLFGLRVRGESMRDAGILPEDVVIVRAQPTANSGDIVVALVDDEATVKTLRHSRGRVMLMPENPDFEPIIPDPERLQILGKVIEVRRYIE